jgi:arsenate reductase
MGSTTIPMPPAPAPCNVLFLCTGNSARSILAEAILRESGGGRFASWSAGSHPTGRVHPMALAMLESLRIPTDGLRSKSWDELARPGAPAMDIVITVCDNAAHEVCPVWPGQPVTAHWGVPDPAVATGDEATVRDAFAETARLLSRRIRLLTGLPLANLDRASLQTRLREIGRDAGVADAA